LRTAIAKHALSDASAAKRESLSALGELHGVFQPIIAVAKGEIIAYEGLIRGPTSLHLPAALFAAAAARGCSDELEYRASEVIVRGFAAAGLSGLLFVNFSAQRSSTWARKAAASSFCRSWRTARYRPENWSSK
jgi:EAL domain-containing protein (putative c-di-GMP-specific phosphodiesterase class I)